MSVGVLFLGIFIGILLSITTISLYIIIKRNRIERLKREEEEFTSAIRAILCVPAPTNQGDDDERKNPYKMDDNSGTEW